MVVEPTLATSDRPGFRHARKLERFIRPVIERSARSLSIDDAADTERLDELRNDSTRPRAGAVERARGTSERPNLKFVGRCAALVALPCSW